MAKGDKYNLPGQEPNHLRLGFAGLNENEIMTALKLLKEAAGELSPARRTILSEFTVWVL